MNHIYNYKDIINKLTVTTLDEASMIEFDIKDKKIILNSINKLSYDELITVRNLLVTQVNILREIIENSFDLDIHCLALGNLDEFIIPIGREVLSILEDKYNTLLRYEDCNAFLMS